MIEIEVPSEYLSKAHELSKEMGSLNGSITKGDGNLAGFVGELVVADYLKAVREPTYDYDLILRNGKTIDVKTTRTSVEPLPAYSCNISNWNTKQKCDYYVFTRLLYNFNTCWILGYMPKAAYFKEANFFKKGDQNGRWVNKTDTYDLAIEKLRPIETLKKVRKKS